MTEKRFKKVMGFIQDNTCEGGDVEGVMDLSEIEDMLNGLVEENEQLQETNEKLQQKYDKLCIEMANIYSKYIFMKEFSEDTNPNEAVKYVLRELMQKTKEVR